MSRSRRGKEVYLGAALGLCAVVAGFVYFGIGRTPAAANAQTAKVDAARPVAYQYKVVVLADLFPEYAKGDSPVLARWSDPKTKADPRTPTEAEAIRRVTAEINRLGEEGWEAGDFAKQVWPGGTAPSGVMFFRKAR